MAEVPLSNGGAALVDDTDFERVAQYRWCRGAYGYPVGWVAGRMIVLHRFLMNAPPGSRVDHKNGDRCDARRGNLRFCTHAENNRNKRGTSAVSGIKGAYWDKSKGKYLAQLKCGGRTYYLGRYADPIAAGLAYWAKARELFGEFASTNLPPEVLAQAGERPGEQPDIGEQGAA